MRYTIRMRQRDTNKLWKSIGKFWPHTKDGLQDVNAHAEMLNGRFHENEYAVFEYNGRMKFTRVE